MEKRSLIGLLSNDLVGAYQNSFWAGMKAAARGENCDLVSFNGGELGAKDPIKLMRLSAYELVAHAKPDALVILAPVLANFSAPDQVQAFLASLGPIPFLTVGFAVAGHPSVQVDNAQGMEVLVDHVVEFHGRRNLAYLGGPLLNPEARERREVFLKGLKRHGCVFDPRLELVGEFDFGIARDRVRSLLDSGVKFDALVAANDNMALGAMEALRERGIRVPDDVLVGGFDDTEEGLCSTPALMTIHQPLFEQGKTSLQLAIDLCEGVEVAALTFQPATLVRRGSCGCRSQCWEEAKGGIRIARPGSGTEKSFGSAAHRDAVRGACNFQSETGSPSLALDELLAAMAIDTVHGAVEATSVAFVNLLEVASSPEDDLDHWQIFLSRLRIATLPFVPPAAVQLAAFEGLVHQLRVEVHERTVQALAYRSLQMERWSHNLHETGCRLVNSFELSHLVETLARDLKGLQISSFHLLLGELGTGGMRLVLSVDNSVRATVPVAGLRIEVGELFQRIIRKSPVRRAFLVEPLFFGTTPLGFMLLELATRRGMLLDSLRGQISASLMGSRIIVDSRRAKPIDPDPEVLIGW